MASHSETSPGSFDECRLSAEVAANPTTWTVNPPEKTSYHPHPPSPFILLLLLNPKAGTHFTVSRRVED